MRTLSLAVCVLALCVVSNAHAQPRGAPPRAQEPLSVHIESPSAGVMDGELVTTFEARVLPWLVTAISNVTADPSATGSDVMS